MFTLLNPITLFVIIYVYCKVRDARRVKRAAEDMREQLLRFAQGKR